jgi:hypothetical protein
MNNKILFLSFALSMTTTQFNPNFYPSGLVPNDLVQKNFQKSWLHDCKSKTQVGWLLTKQDDPSLLQLFETTKKFAPYIKNGTDATIYDLVLNDQKLQEFAVGSLHYSLIYENVDAEKLLTILSTFLQQKINFKNNDANHRRELCWNIAIKILRTSDFYTW